MKTTGRKPVGISFDSSLLQALDSHLSQSGEQRSGYIARLVSSDLATRGALPGSKKSALRKRFEELLSSNEAKAEAILSII
jgi:metal-responsive CopG/Arc/MetJ family transcriptional regulator